MKYIINILHTLFKSKTKGTGALIDNRQAKEKNKDYKFEEIVTSVSPVNWIKKTEAEWRKFPIFNQNHSGSCVAHTLAKMLGVLYWLDNKDYVHFSATDIYQRRKNKPKMGMIGVDAFNIARQGVTLEELSPSQNMSDKQMDNTEIKEYKHKVGEIFKINNYVILPTKDIEKIASVIQTTKKSVMVWFYFKYPEWTTVPTRQDSLLSLNDPKIVRHSLTAVDYTLYNNKKALIIEDSWGTKYGKNGQRIITEDFFKFRNFFAAYALNFKFDDKTNQTTTKPKYTFTKTLRFSSKYIVNEDVKHLQDILKYEGLFPINVDSTGYYGSITAKAVLAFQLKHKVDTIDELNNLMGYIVGPKTIAKLNELYSL